MEFRKPVSELIAARKSSRTYEVRALEPGARAELLAACASPWSGLLNEPARFWLVERPEPEMRGLKLGLGLIANVSSVLVGAVRDSRLACASFGYVMEALVLKATDLGLATCWVGFFDPKWFPELGITEQERSPSLVAVGHATPRRSARERLLRMAIKADSRKPWNELFFRDTPETALSRDEAGGYAGALDMLRLAPSAGNTQPWRVVKSEEEFRFFIKPTSPRYEARHLHDVDIGIALCHFELAAREAGLRGSWVATDDAPAVPGMRYVITWRTADCGVRTAN
jgi:nitroreductase